MATKRDVLKKAVTIVAAAGTTKIVKGIIEHNTNPERVTDKVTIYVAAAALGGMLADLTSRYTSSRIDQFADEWNKHFSWKI